MKEFKYVITDKEGIHARPAGELIKVVKGFNSTIKIAKDGKEADCKRMFAVMGLGVKNGQEVVFTFDGEDEDAACEAVSKLMQAFYTWFLKFCLALNSYNYCNDGVIRS